MQVTSIILIFVSCELRIDDLFMSVEFGSYYGNDSIRCE